MDNLEISVKEEVEDEDDDYMEFIPEIVLKEDHEDHSVLVKEALVQSDSEDEENDDFDPFSGDSKQRRVETKRKVINKKTPTKAQLQAKTIEKAMDIGDSDFDSEDDIALSKIKREQEKEAAQKLTEDGDKTNLKQLMDKTKKPGKTFSRKITRELKYICLAKKCKKVPIFESPFEYIDHMKVIHEKTLSVAKIRASISIRKDAKPIIQIDPENCSDFLICKKCNHEFSTLAGLERHTEKGKCHKVQCNFICNYCNKDMQRMDLRILHIELEHAEEEKNDFLTCQICNEKFETKLEIAGHYTEIHNNQFECQHCPKNFTQAKFLIIHIRQQHRLVGFKCDDCGKVCRSVKELQIHKQVHNKEANIKCSGCDLMFTSEVKMTYHFNSVHNAGEFTCEICAKTFITRLKLSHHKYERHKEKAFQCHICAKNFVRNEELVRHVLWHEGLYTYKKKDPNTTRDITYSCSICDMKTVFRSSMRQHMKYVHTGEKRRRYKYNKRNDQTFFCEICNRHFSENRYYKKHMSRKSVHMMHRCEICNLEILGIVNFRSHKTVHSNKNV